LDRAEYLGSVHRAGREARELGARYAAAEAAATNEVSGVRAYPAAAAERATTGAEADEITPVGVFSFEQGTW